MAPTVQQEVKRREPRAAGEGAVLAAMPTTISCPEHAGQESTKPQHLPPGDPLTPAPRAWDELCPGCLRAMVEMRSH